MPLPATRGQDVWPFFGGNTQNYGEIVFDDGLDGNYAALWHMNELVDRYGEFDGTATADSSAKGNDGTLTGGASFVAGHTASGLTFDGLAGHVALATNVSPWLGGRASGAPCWRLGRPARWSCWATWTCASTAPGIWPSIGTCICRSWPCWP